MRAGPGEKPSVCFIGLTNLPVLTTEYAHHGVGGAQLQQTLLAKALVQRGYKVAMIVADYGQPDGAQWAGIRTYKAYRFAAGVPILRFIHPRWTGVWAALKRADADIYYTSCADMMVGEMALFARLHGRKSIFRIASDLDCDPDRLFIRLLRDKLIYRFGLSNVDLVLAQTESQQQAMARNFRRGSRVISSLAHSNRTRRSFAERDVTVLWVSTLRPLKRPELFLQLAERLPHIEFHLIGGPADEAPDCFERTREQAGTLPNMHFLGFVPFHEIDPYFERARVLVNTSDVEGFPNTYLQAWSHGTPVVAFHDPDKTIVRNALGNAVATLEQMCSAVATLAEQADAWTACSRACCVYFDRTYDDDRVIEAFVAAVDNVASARTAI